MQEKLTKKAERFIREQKLIEAGERVLVGLSGGADSVCLAAVLHELSDTLSIRLGAFHVNHGIRGKEADADEAFSQKFCETLGIDFYAVHEDVPLYAKEHRIGLEEAGRELRYRAAESLAAGKGYDKIALAHQQNDVAETFLFHLFRGSSVSGLSSIPARRGNIIRPLLFCDREEIEAYLKEKGLSFCVDATNKETEYTRNKIRHHVLSYAGNYVNEGAVRHTAEAAAELGALNEYLFAEAEEICAQAQELLGEVRIPVSALEKKHRVLQDKAVHMLLTKAAGSARDFTRAHVEAVRELCFSQSGKQVSLPYGLAAGRNFEELFIQRVQSGEDAAEEREYLVRVPGEYCIGDAGEKIIFRCFPYKKNAEIPKNEYTKWFDYGKIKGTLRLRTRKEGDRIGMKQGSKSVKALLIEKKIAREERKKRLLLADDEQVLWVPGVRSCDNYRIDEATKTVLEVRMNGGSENEGRGKGTDSGSRNNETGS